MYVSLEASKEDKETAPPRGPSDADQISGRDETSALGAMPNSVRAIRATEAE